MLFTTVRSTVEDLIRDVRNGRIGLPDLQRPFVWKDVKVRDLLDSMLKGYPIGFVMLWEAPDSYDNVSHIGKNEKKHSRPDYLVIDGQQRLTALLSALYGVPVKDKNYQERTIKISYNPLQKENFLAVWTKAIDNNVEWIPCISDIVGANERNEISKFRRAYIRKVNGNREKNNLPMLTDDEEDFIEERLKDILDVLRYELPTLEIRKEADEEDVASIFVRVNSGGQNLNENSFIETLLSVYDNETHELIHQFCADSWIIKEKTSYNPILKLAPSHLIRMVIGVGFRRTRLRYAYMLLRGRNLQTRSFSEEERERNLTCFKETLKVVTSLNNWHDFINLFLRAGYVKDFLVTSSNVVVFSYVLYLIGKYQYKVPILQLHHIITVWIFMTSITGFYSSSTESTVEKQFADFRSITTANGFVQYLQQTIDTAFTDDFFMYTLPKELNSASPLSPGWLGYIASLNILGTPMLFSTIPMSRYFDMGISGTKRAYDKHHIFPKNYLTKVGYETDRERNQIANFTYLDYNTNIYIADKPPKEYIHEFKEKLGAAQYELSCQQNGLPENFEQLEYTEFLRQRRVLMARIIKKAYIMLKHT